MFLFSRTASIKERQVVMVNRNDVIELPITQEELELAMAMSSKSEIGGESRIREKQDRMNNLRIDQFIGTGLGELAGNKYFFSVDHYVRTREERNKNPFSGDNGSDTDGYRINYKTSRLRLHSDYMNYKLAVRSHERYKDLSYVLVAVQTYNITDVNALVFGPIKPKVYLVGWATDQMLDGNQETNGLFGGAFCLYPDQLLKVKDLKANLSHFKEYAFAS